MLISLAPFSDYSQRAESFGISLGYTMAMLPKVLRRFYPEKIGRSWMSEPGKQYVIGFAQSLFYTSFGTRKLSKKALEARVCLFYFLSLSDHRHECIVGKRSLSKGVEKTK